MSVGVRLCIPAFHSALSRNHVADVSSGSAIFYSPTQLVLGLLAVTLLPGLHCMQLVGGLLAAVLFPRLPCLQLVKNVLAATLLSSLLPCSRGAANCSSTSLPGHDHDSEAPITLNPVEARRIWVQLKAQTAAYLGPTSCHPVTDKVS